MRTLVIGRNSQLGMSLHKVLTGSEQSDGFVFVGRDELDLSSKDSVDSYFANNKFDVIVNCAAYTKVDEAEENADLANQINCIAVKWLSCIANQHQSRLIHISTDYVFDGISDSPYIESDRTNPVNVYGKSKLAGEKVLQKIVKRGVIIRTSWLYSEFGDNFVKTLLILGQKREEISVVCDQVGSPTYATDLANVVLKIIKSEKNTAPDQAVQIYHYSNKGRVSWFEFSRAIFSLSEGVYCWVKPVTTEEYPSLAKRPKYTELDKQKIERCFGIRPPFWKESLERCLSELL